VIAASQIVALHAGFERLIHPLDVLPPFCDLARRLTQVGGVATEWRVPKYMV
jgi:hypothetical protein